MNDQLNKILKDLEVYAFNALAPIELEIKQRRLRVKSSSFGSYFMQQLSTSVKYYGCSYFIQTTAGLTNLKELEHTGHKEIKIEIIIYDYKID